MGNNISENQCEKCMGTQKIVVWDINCLDCSGTGVLKYNVRSNYSRHYLEIDIPCDRCKTSGITTRPKKNIYDCICKTANKKEFFILDK